MMSKRERSTIKKSLVGSWIGPIRQNSKLIAKFLLAILIIAVGAWFFKHQETEMGQIKYVLLSSRIKYILLGTFLTVIYIILQGEMYKMAFASVNVTVSLQKTVILFLKRNFISIFMPAGGVTSLAFFNDEIEKDGTSGTKIHFASLVYAFTGILTVVLVSVPILIYTFYTGVSVIKEIHALLIMIAFISGIYLAYRSFMRKGSVYRLIIRLIPSSEIFLDEIISHEIDSKYLIITIIISIIIDISNILIVFVAMKALGFKASLLFAMLGYLTGVFSSFVSPFMRGLGAIELSMSFVLTKLGYPALQALAITLLYRFFEFWIPLLSGALSFMMKINKLIMRIIPAFLIFALGIVNIISSTTPAIAVRIHRLENFIPVDAISASNYFVFISGAFMLLTAIFMLKGLRNAWWIALLLSLLSCIGHLTKAIDYEEAIFAFIIVSILIFSRKEYVTKGNPKLHAIGIWSAVLSMATVIIYGSVGFYFLDRKHFGIEFNLWQSINYTLRYFILLGNTGLSPSTHFARDFIVSINVSGFVSLAFLVYTILKPRFFRESQSPEEIEKAKTLLEKYGRSGLDYFKTYFDKQIFQPTGIEAFIAYRTSGNYAVVLEDPVAGTPDDFKLCVSLFDKYCYENGLKSIYYRVPEESLGLYKELSKKSLFLGQEGIVNLDTFTLEGGRNKALRNAINKVIDEGYRSSVHLPPVKDGILQKIKAVSDEWLESTGRSEIVFSQGMFRWDEMKSQTIITVENSEEKVIAFLNIIPDYSPGEGTYDLIRKTEDSPHGVLDFLLVELFKYLKSQGYSSVNLGFAPLSGIEEPQTFPERSMRFAYEKIRSFSHFRGLRNFKEKFLPSWHNKYLVYSQDYDLILVPAVLNSVIKPGND